MSVDYAVLGDIIRRERELRQLSQESLAALAGISRTFIGEVERGTAKLSFESLVAIADGLGMNLSEIVIEYERLSAPKR